MPASRPVSSDHPRLTRRGAPWLAALTLLALLLAGSTALAAGPVQVSVVADTPKHLVLRYRIQGYDLEPVSVGNQIYQRVGIGRESRLKQPGAPALPTVNRSVVIPNDQRMVPRVLHASYTDVPDVDVLPSRGILYRNVDPATIPYAFGAPYHADGMFPGRLVSLRDPYLMRDYRGLVVELYPVQYNPVQRVLRIYDELIVELVPDGTSQHNVPQGLPGDSLAFHRIAKHHFLNFASQQRYDPLGEDGEMLIIAHDDWLPNVAPLVTHKNAIGITTTAVGISSVGNDVGSITAYLQDAYDNSNLAFVLLVGDAAHIATPQASGGASDPSYAKLAGNDDYPDVLIGRLSAESAADVDTQVQRTIQYEVQEATQQPWFKTAVGIGSDEGPGDDNEMDWEHIDNIRTDLLGYGYTTVDQLYDPGASASAVSAALNQGRGLINYCGHGSETSWVSTGFDNGDINGLTNDNKLPFIFSVACVNGAFDYTTCFGETWLRATNNGAPTGAIGIYASSINQSWDPPMAAQDESNDLLVAEQYFSFGALAFAGSALMIDEYGSGGVEMYDTWHVFGDPSVRVFGTVVPPTGLRVEPAQGFAAEGDAGGPFEPMSTEYTLTNLSEFPIDYSVSAAEQWLTLTSPSGTLGAGDSAVVTVSLNLMATSLAKGTYVDTLQFINHTDHDGDTDRPVLLTVGIPHLQYEWPLDSDPGWTAEGDWAFGQPTGHGGEQGGPDPDSGHSGDNVYGYNLNGDYTNNLNEQHLTTAAIDCSHLTDVSLRFWRWLGVETSQYDHAYIRASNDGSTWTTVWENGGQVADSDWIHQEVDLSAVADRQSTVYLRWTMGATDMALHFCGWNIDDVEIWGIPECTDADDDGYEPVPCGGGDCDDQDDAISPDADEICDDGIDNDCDEDVDGDDDECDDQPDAGPGGGGTGGTGGDAGAGGVGGEVPMEPFTIVDDGCGCRQAPSRDTPWAASVLALLGLAGLRRRRSSPRGRRGHDRQRVSGELAAPRPR